MIKVLIGISGSGKSTRAKQIASETGAVVVGRDKIREMAFGFDEASVHEFYTREDVKDCEKTVTTICDAIIKQAVVAGNDVVLDNTHLKAKALNDVIKKWNRFTDIEFELIECDGVTALANDMSRNRSVGTEVIKAQFQSLKNLLASDFDFSSRPSLISKIVRNPELPNCVIFDIDGTLADKGSRFAFDWKKVESDTLRENVFRAFQMHKEAGDHMVICTGRDGVCEPETRAWLDKFGIEFDEFHIRTPKDNRPDWAIKEELWREISKRFNITVMFDDRDQVVEHARNLGLECFQVAPGDF